MAAPIVLVVKSSGVIRVYCSDHKLTVNKAVLKDSYPLPETEDLFASLADGKLFIKLDLSHAYQQLCLDTKSKQFITNNTHRGLFQYNCLPFGVSSAIISTSQR